MKSMPTYDAVSKVGGELTPEQIAHYGNRLSNEKRLNYVRRSNGMEQFTEISESERFFASVEESCEQFAVEK